MNFDGRYQLVIFGTGAKVSAQESILLAALNSAFAALGLVARYLDVHSSRTRASIDPKMPIVGIFFGFSANPRLSSNAKDRLDLLLDNGSLIIPVVEDNIDFNSVVPFEISHLNGVSIKDCGENLTRLVARILEGFGLVRDRRRVFISYRRREARGVASQLYEALDSAGFDAFLDTSVVRPGEPFQEVLWHRLADTDVVVILDTPNFLGSRWTEEELARSNTSTIQILQLLWPGCAESAPAAFSTFYPLEDANFTRGKTGGPSATLKQNCVNKIVDSVESLRARALAARHAYLVGEFQKEAKAANFEVHLTVDRRLVLRTPSGDKILMQPAVGVPDAEGYESLHGEELTSGGGYMTPSILLYDETGIRDRWLKHLAWLDGNLSCVKSLSLTQAKAWLDRLATGGAP